MRYDEIREHVRDYFAQLLENQREAIAKDGPPTPSRMMALRTSLGLAEEGPEVYMDAVHPNDGMALLSQFCASRGFPLPEGSESRQMLEDEYFKGFRDFLKRAIDLPSEFETISIASSTIQDTTHKPKDEPASEPETTLTYDETVSRYFDEQQHTEPLAPKTMSDKTDALALLKELTEGKPTSELTKRDAQAVKAALLKLPKNRRTNPTTRELTISQMLELEGVPCIAARTVNTYIGNMSHFFDWAHDNGFASQNIFSGLRIKNTKPKAEKRRSAFNTKQLNTVFSALIDTTGRTKKDEHKWPALIAMFTGMRLNEIAQLELQDIGQEDGVWFINVTLDGDPNKRLKNEASQRRVPLHNRLIECGVLDFHNQQLERQHTRLFPTLPFCKNNGYGRNSGRWFNDRLLRSVDLKDKGFSFHCFRHTFITRLAQADADETKLKAIVGHYQPGVTWNTYFKEGFKPHQLKKEIDKFDF